MSTTIMSRCEKCLNGIDCKKLNNNKCKNFVVSVDSNFNYEPEQQIECFFETNKFLEFVN
jgi:hypothetical protein